MGFPPIKAWVYTKNVPDEPASWQELGNEELVMEEDIQGVWRIHLRRRCDYNALCGASTLIDRSGPVQTVDEYLDTKEWRTVCRRVYHIPYTRCGECIRLAGEING